MERFLTHDFISLFAKFGELRARAGERGDQPLDSAVLALIEEIMPRLESVLTNVGLVFTAKLSTRSWGPKNTSRQLSQWSEELIRRLSDEMEGKTYLAIEPSLTRYYDEPRLFGDDVFDNFPSSSFDIEEAGKCLALKRGTACVFHLMRALEPGLYSIATALNIEDIQENWQNAIDQIEKAINEVVRNPASRKGDANQRASWKRNAQFYSEAATHFLYIKEAWRNHASHTGQVYPDEKARQVFESAKGFMQHLATRLSEASA